MLKAAASKPRSRSFNVTVPDACAISSKTPHPADDMRFTSRCSAFLGFLIQLAINGSASCAPARRFHMTPKFGAG